MIKKCFFHPKKKYLKIKVKSTGNPFLLFRHPISSSSSEDISLDVNLDLVSPFDAFELSSHSLFDGAAPEQVGIRQISIQIQIQIYHVSHLVIIRFTIRINKTCQISFTSLIETSSAHYLEQIPGIGLNSLDFRRHFSLRQSLHVVKTKVATATPDRKKNCLNSLPTQK